jgi:hypothetical protein
MKEFKMPPLSFARSDREEMRKLVEETRKI